MSKYKEKLEVQYRLVRIKKIKTAIYSLQLILLIILSAFCIYQYGSFKPFFLPLDLIILLASIIALALVIESIFFRAMEIFYAKESSTKHLMTTNSMRKSIGMIIAFAVIFALLFTPKFVQFIENEISVQENDLWINTTRISRDFPSKDTLGLTKVSNVTVEIEYGEVNVTILLETGIPIHHRIVSQGHSETFNIEKSIEGYKELILIINNTAGSEESELNYTINSHLSSIFVGIIPIFSIFFIIINLVWMVSLYPLKKRYAPHSIYSKRYVSLKDVGVEVWSERGTLVIKKDDRVIPLYQEEANTPKIKAKQPIKPVDKKIKEEKKPVSPSAELDDKLLIEEKIDKSPKIEKKAPELLEEKKKQEAELIGDIMCPSCGVLNSPYAFLCYSCGCNIREVKIEEKEAKDKAYENLMNIPNIGAIKAKYLYNAGFKNLATLASSSIDELSKIKGISRKSAKEIIEYLKDQ